MFVNMTEFQFAKKLHPVWGKIPAMSHAFQQYPSAEWVWWLDMDAIIMTPSLDLYKHVLSPSAMEEKILRGLPIKTNPEVPIHSMDTVTIPEVRSNHSNRLTTEYRFLKHRTYHLGGQEWTQCRIHSHSKYPNNETFHGTLERSYLDQLCRGKIPPPRAKPITTSNFGASSITGTSWICTSTSYKCISRHGR